MNFIILGSHTDYCKVMCQDIINNDNVYFENKSDYLNSKTLKLIRKIHLSERINKFLEIPFKKFWYTHYIDNKKIKKNANNIFVFFDSNIHVYEKNFVHYLKEEYNAHVVLLLVNSIHSIQEHNPNYFRDVFDLVFTTDPSDANKYAFNYLKGVYSKKLTLETRFNTEIEQDIFFVGANKGRLDMLHNVASKLNQYGVNYAINITNVTEPEQRHDIKVQYNKRMDYDEVIKNVVSSNCILEVVQKGQSGITLRTIEAIIYNKKLLTNNTNIINSDLFNPQYMRVFTDIEDIDVNFILNKEKVDYRYHGEYSPERFIEKLEEFFCNK